MEGKQGEIGGGGMAKPLLTRARSRARAKAFDVWCGLWFVYSVQKCDLMHVLPHRKCESILSRRVFLRNTTSRISDPICYENYHTFTLGRDRKFHVCTNFRCEIVFLRNTRPDEIRGKASRVGNPSQKQSQSERRTVMSPPSVRATWKVECESV